MSNIRSREICFTSVYQEQIDLVYDTIVSEIICSPENEKKIRTVYEEKISYLHNKIQEKVILTECENEYK